MLSLLAVVLIGGRFRKLLPILTSRHISFRTRGRVFSARVCFAILHGSETLLICNGFGLCYDQVDVRLQIGRKDPINCASSENCYWWDYGHLTRSDGLAMYSISPLSSTMSLDILDTREHGRPRKIWFEGPEYMEGRCEPLHDVADPDVEDTCSTLNSKTRRKKR